MAVGVTGPPFEKFTVRKTEFHIVLYFPPTWKLMQDGLLFHRWATRCKFPFILQEWFPVLYTGFQLRDEKVYILHVWNIDVEAFLFDPSA